MNNLQKVSDITAADVAEYLKIPAPTDDILSQMEVALTIAKDTVLVNCNMLKDVEDLDQRKCFIGAVFKECEIYWYGEDAVAGGGKFLNNIYSMYERRAYPKERNTGQNQNDRGLIDG